MWRPVRRLRNLGVTVIVLLGLQIVCLGIGIAAHVRRIDLVDDIFAGRTPSQRTWNAANLLADTFMTIGFILFIACGIVWLIWQHRGQANARTLTGERTKFTSGWAVGWWFIPLANLFMPFLTMLDLARISIGRDRWLTQGFSVLIPLWWIAWLGFVFTGLGLSGGGLTYVAMRNDDRLAIVSASIGILAAALAIWIVRAVTSRQDAVASEQPRTPPPPPPDVAVAYAPPPRPDAAPL
jgi:Domain of unknown function (DUF4328)